MIRLNKGLNKNNTNVYVSSICIVFHPTTNSSTRYVNSDSTFRPFVHQYFSHNVSNTDIPILLKLYTIVVNKYLNHELWTWTIKQSWWFARRKIVRVHNLLREITICAGLSFVSRLWGLVVCIIMYIQVADECMSLSGYKAIT